MGKEISQGQVRFNVYTGDLVVPKIPDLDNKLIESRIISREDKKPNCAYINTEGLEIIRERINKDKPTFDGTNEELAKKLLVFMGGRTQISLDPSDEIRRGYSVKLNIGIIAWKTPSMDPHDIPINHDFYQLLGVYNQYKGTGKVSTDKSIRKYATIQKSNCSHPEPLRLGEYFFARPIDSIKMELSKIEKTGYYWGK